MRVQINPAAGPNGEGRTVRHPISHRPFPSEPFDLSDKDLNNPQVLRLLPPPGQPGGVAGGVFADLVPVEAAMPQRKPRGRSADPKE